MRFTPLIITLLLFLGCREERQPTSTTWQDPSPHSTRFVRVGPNHMLEILDWGGRGRPIVLLAGLNNTAHIFDDFAPALTDSFRVFGITRRGFGQSSQPPANDINALVRDLKIVVDSLAVGPVFLIGHSIAGEEMTSFAGIHPENCRGLVYLDAAYDRSGFLSFLQKNPYPAFPPMTHADSSSPEAVRQYAVRTFGFEYPPTEVRMVLVFDSTGRYVSDVTPDSIAYPILGRLQRPNYRRVRRPSLSVYAIADSVEILFPFYRSLDSAGQALARRSFEAWRSYSRQSIVQFRKETTSATVLEIHNAHHYVFISHRDQVLKAIRTFLAAN